MTSINLQQEDLYNNDNFVFLTKFHFVFMIVFNTSFVIVDSFKKKTPEIPKSRKYQNCCKPIECGQRVFFFFLNMLC